MGTKVRKIARLDKEYVVFDPKGHATSWKADDFWAMAFDASHPKNKKSMGYLISQYEFSEDWNSWEKHPNGDELVICLSGAMTFVLDLPEGKKKVQLKAGNSVLVPKNTWHTAKVRESVQAIFVTWGFGTKHKANNIE